MDKFLGSSPTQIVILAALAGMAIAIVWMLRQYSLLKQVRNDMFDAYMNSDAGKAATVAKVREYMNSQDGMLVQSQNLRAYLTNNEGSVFMEGVINGKVRKEVEKHNAAIDAHYLVRERLVDTDSFNGMVKRLELDCSEGRKALLKMMKEEDAK